MPELKEQKMPNGLALLKKALRWNTIKWYKTIIGMKPLKKQMAFMCVVCGIVISGGLWVRFSSKAEVHLIYLCCQCDLIKAAQDQCSCHSPFIHVWSVQTHLSTWTLNRFKNISTYVKQQKVCQSTCVLCHVLHFIIQMKVWHHLTSAHTHMRQQSKVLL